MTNINTVHSTLVKNINNSAENLKNLVDGKEGVRDSESASFSSRLKSSIENINVTQQHAANMVKDFEVGKESDVSKVMVAQQVSSLGFHLVLNVRNKAIGAYREIMNMQV